jgi:signal transduction histidine kinase
MINKIVRFLIFISLSLSVTPALTQPDHVNGYSVQHFTDENGLPQNSINNLLFDKNGYLWLASQVGLVRFNGSSFKLYYPDDKPVMESNIVYLGKNDKGIIYFQTDDHNLYRYPGNNSQFLSPLNKTAEALRRQYLLNDRKQVFDFTRFLRYQHHSPEGRLRRHIFEDLSSHNENFFAIDSSCLYIAYHDSLYYFDDQTLKVVSALPDHNLQYLVLDRKLYVLNKDVVNAVYEAGQKIQGQSFIEGDLHSAAKSMDRSDTAVRYRLFASDTSKHLLAGQRLYRIYADGAGRLRSVFLVNLDFISNISAVEYNEGLDVLLVATYTEGFYFLRRNRFQLKDWPVQLREKMSRFLFGPLALYKDKDILTDKFTFSTNGSFSPVKDSLPLWQRCLYVDRKNQVWGAAGNLPRKLTPAMAPVKVFPALDGEIVDYKEDTGGELYCLTAKSLWKMEADSFRRVFTIGHLAGGANESFSQVGPHRFWIANTDGLMEYDAEKQNGRSFPELSGTDIRAIHVCRDGAVLIGTYGQGYFYFYHQHLFRMPLDRNGFLITSHCFIEDNKGYIWIPCNKGLFKVPKADMDAWCEDGGGQLYYYYYGRQDGLLTNEFNGGFNSCGVITPGGLISLLSMKGMVCFYADSLSTYFPHGAIDMTHIEVDGRPVDRTDTISLSAGYDNLALEISCPYLGNRNNLYLQYNLAGLNDEWKDITEDGIISLPRLAAGKYELRVRKVNGFGKNNYQYRAWDVVVTPYFYRTTWFVLLVILAVSALLLLLVQLRLKLVEKKNEIRIKAEKLRGTVVRLEETVAALRLSEQALLRTSRQREKLISLVIHDLRSPLRFLTMLAGDLHDNQSQLSAAAMKDRTYWVKKGAQDIYNFSEDFLLWVTSQKDNFNISKRLFAVRPLLQEIYDFYSEQVSQKGNHISYAADENLRLYSDPHMLITIIRNLTDNANKYTDRGAIRIEAVQEGDQVVISVSDTGRGMNPQQVAAFLGKDGLDNIKSGSQLGHKFVIDLTYRLDGRLSVDSREKAGTTVRLHLPVGQAEAPASVPPAPDDAPVPTVKDVV